MDSESAPWPLSTCPGRRNHGSDLAYYLQAAGYCNADPGVEREAGKGNPKFFFRARIGIGNMDDNLRAAAHQVGIDSSGHGTEGLLQNLRYSLAKRKLTKCRPEDLADSGKRHLLEHNDSHRTRGALRDGGAAVGKQRIAIDPRCAGRILESAQRSARLTQVRDSELPGLEVFLHKTSGNRKVSGASWDFWRLPTRTRMAEGRS